MTSVLKQITMMAMCLVLLVPIYPFQQAEAAVRYEDIPVPNAGFEEPGTDGDIPGWHFTNTSSRNAYSVVDSIAYDGDYSLKMLDLSNNAYGLESDMIPVTEGETYSARVRVYLEPFTEAETEVMEKNGIDENLRDVNRPGLYLRFYAENGERLSQKSVDVTEPLNEWTSMAVERQVAPEGAKYATVMFWGFRANVAKVYLDAVTLKREVQDETIEERFTNLGGMITDSPISAGAVSKDAKGNTVLYTVVNGYSVNPSQLTTINVETGETQSFPLEGARTAWALTVAPDQRVYIGSQTRGYLYRYDPSTQQVETLGQAVGETHIWSLVTTPNGKVYGGTYGNGKVFEYDPETNEFTDLGTMVEGQQYVRTLAYDAAENTLYAGIMTEPHIIKYDLDTGEKTDITPDSYKDGNGVYAKMQVSGDKLFVMFDQTRDAIVIDKHTGEVEYEIPTPLSGHGFSEPSPVDGNVYYITTNSESGKRELYYYGIHEQKAHLAAELGDLPGGFYTAEFAQLNAEEYPGYSLIMLLANRNIGIYNVQTGAINELSVELSGNPLPLLTLIKGPDGKMYASSSRGSIASYDPVTGEKVQNRGIGNSRLGTLGDKIYGGIYPGAAIYEYDPALEWNPDGDGKLNPRMLFEMGLPGPEAQDRPNVLLGVEEKNKLFIGSIADYGLLPGALTVYDPATETKETHKNIVTDQSVVTLAYHDEIVYGATSIWGATGVNPTQSEAKLFGFDVDKGEKTFELVPVPEKKAITGITTSPDGKVWGMAEGTLFIYNPDTGQIEETTDLLDITYRNTTWRDATLLFGRDGHLYMTIQNKLLKVDSQTKEVTVLKEGDTLNQLAQDNWGNLYFHLDSELWKYADPAFMSIDALKAKLNVLRESGDIEQPLYAQLNNSLRQAKHHKDHGRLTQAVQHMEKFLKHLNNKAMEKFITPEAKSELHQDAEALLQTWLNE